VTATDGNHEQSFAACACRPRRAGWWRRPDPRQDGRPGAQHPDLHARRRRPLIIKKVLESAIANAEHNDGADIDELQGARRSTSSKAPTLQAFHRARQGPRQPHQQAHLPHLRDGRQLARGKEDHGTKDSSDRLPPSGHPQLVVALVRQQPRLRRHAGTKTSRSASTCKASSRTRRSARILIERPAKNARITIYSARPGVVIGKKGEDIENAARPTCASMLGVPVARQHRRDPQARDSMRS